MCVNQGIDVVAKILLIGGTSHAGKSTLAAHVAQRLGWRSLSTDSLARHPGRPWRQPPALPPPHVVAHYRDLTLPELMQSVLLHYEMMWGAQICPLIVHETGLIIEGSALLPHQVVSILSPDVRGAWLVANDDTIENRIRHESDYESRDGDERVLIDAFAARAVAFNRLILAEVVVLGLHKIEIDDVSGIEALTSMLLDELNVGKG